MNIVDGLFIEELEKRQTLSVLFLPSPGGDATTMAVGEEGATTMAVGEENGGASGGAYPAKTILEECSRNPTPC